MLRNCMLKYIEVKSHDIYNFQLVKKKANMANANNC